MRFLIKLLAVTFVAWTLSLIVSTESSAQAKKKDSGTETSISVNYPIYSVIYTEGTDEEGNSLGMAPLQVHDRQGQTNDLDYHRMNARARENDPVSPYTKVIFMEELGGFNFRLAENMEERSRKPDGVNTLLVHSSQFLPAHRIKFPGQ